MVTDRLKLMRLKCGRGMMEPGLGVEVTGQNTVWKYFVFEFVETCLIFFLEESFDHIFPTQHQTGFGEFQNLVIYPYIFYHLLGKLLGFSYLLCTLYNNRKKVTFATPVVWKEPKDYSTDYYLCITKIVGKTNTIKKNIKNPNLFSLGVFHTATSSYSSSGIYIQKTQTID